MKRCKCVREENLKENMQRKQMKIKWIIGVTEEKKYYMSIVSFPVAQLVKNLPAMWEACI